ncbi:MAG: EAL domain-containing protein, partial [Thiobacillus sp.]|nr:EAL domain-containing protein [Thiobacillus sp.]
TLSDKGLILEANLTAATLLGYTRGALVKQPVTRFILKEDQDIYYLYRNQLFETGASQACELRMVKQDGTLFWARIEATNAQEEGGVPVGRVVMSDVTEHKLVEDKLRLAASVFTHAHEGIMITASDGAIIDVNDAFSQITGYSRDEVIGRNPRILSSGRQEPAFYAAMWRDLVEHGYWYGEVWNQRKSGELYVELQAISAVRDAKGNVLQYVSLFSDITELKEHALKLERIAHYDALTTLPNRVLLADRLHQAMIQTRRQEKNLAVAYLDLDGFKTINDRHGHEVGDQLLMAVANRMKQVLREGDTLSRLGGDEFVAVLLELIDIESSVPTLTRLLAAAAQPVHVGELVLQVSASIGVTFYPQPGDVDADQLLRQADQAMYQAKLAGKNRYHVFDAEQDRSARGYHESLERIRCALAEREFVLHYQPKVNMRTGTVIGVEALIRWQHPERDLLPPGVFLPVIEDHPLAVELGEWVITSALTQMALWQSAGLDISVSVNIGARQLQQADFVERLRTLLAAHPQVNPSNLKLEILETSALEDLSQVSQVIEACREMDVLFALDDFGTGYSSLTYLKRLPVTQLKIDQSFVRDMLDDPEDMAILEGVIGLAIAFRRQVIAEGVETAEHCEMLLQLGCELAQGYGIARPMPAHALPGWLAAWRPEPHWAELPLVSRDDLPILYAGIEYRAWIDFLEAFLKGKRDDPPSLDQHGRFERWLDAERLAGHGAQPAFQTIEALHRRMHALGVAFCELHAQGRSPEALARLGELHRLRDDMLEQLKTRVKSGWGGR